MTPLPCILLVDDDPITNFINTVLLETLGVTDQLLVALDGADALTQLQQHCVPLTTTCPALILLDVNMPGMNGVQFLEAYQHLSLPYPPVVMMLTTSLHPRDLAQVEQFDTVKGFLSKPLTEEMIHDLLQEHFNQALPMA